MDRDGIRNLEWHNGSGSVSVIVIIGAFDSINIKTHDGVFTIRIFNHLQWHESGGGWIYGRFQLDIKLDSLCWFTHIQFFNSNNSASHIVIDDRVKTVVFQKQNRVSNLVLLDIPFNCWVWIAFLQKPVNVIE